MWRNTSVTEAIQMIANRGIRTPEFSISLVLLTALTGCLHGCGSGGGGTPNTVQTSLRQLKLGDTWNYSSSTTDSTGTVTTETVQQQVVQGTLDGYPQLAISTITTATSDRGIAGPRRNGKPTGFPFTMGAGRTGRQEQANLKYFYQDPVTHDLHILGKGLSGLDTSVTNEGGMSLPGTFSSSSSWRDDLTFTDGTTESTMETVQGSEPISTPAGPFSAWKLLEALPAHPGATITVWLAPEIGQPIKLVGTGEIFGETFTSTAVLTSFVPGTSAGVSTGPPGGGSAPIAPQSSLRRLLLGDTWLYTFESTDLTGSVSRGIVQEQVVQTQLQGLPQLALSTTTTTTAGRAKGAATSAGRSGFGSFGGPAPKTGRQAQGNLEYFYQDAVSHDLHILGRSAFGSNSIVTNEVGMQLPGTFSASSSWADNITFLDGSNETVSDQVQGSATIPTPAGRFGTWRIQESALTFSQSRTTFWIAPEVGQPVRIFRSGSGPAEPGTYTAVLSSFVPGTSPGVSTGPPPSAGPPSPIGLPEVRAVATQVNGVAAVKVSWTDNGPGGPGGSQMGYNIYRSKAGIIEPVGCVGPNQNTFLDVYTGTSTVVTNCAFSPTPGGTIGGFTTGGTSVGLTTGSTIGGVSTGMPSATGGGSTGLGTGAGLNGTGTGGGNPGNLVPSLTPGATYLYLVNRVVSIPGGYYETAVFPPVGPVTPVDPPTLLSPSAGSPALMNLNSFIVTWSGVLGAGQYELQVSDSADFRSLRTYTSPLIAADGHSTGTLTAPPIDLKAVWPILPLTSPGQTYTIYVRVGARSGSDGNGQPELQPLTDPSLPPDTPQDQRFIYSATVTTQAQ